MTKINFDPKFRPQIESGKYKVETRDGRPARIICWDRMSQDGESIVALVDDGIRELNYFYKNTGRFLTSHEDTLDLFMITPEPELTEFEQKPAELPKSEDYGIDGLYAAIDILQKTLGEVYGYQTDDGILEHKCAISAVKELYEQKPAKDDTRTKIISRATSEKQVVLLSESNGNAEIVWDTRSLEDTKNLLEQGILFINKQLSTKPTEWSEEDKDTIVEIISDLCALKDWIVKYDANWLSNPILKNMDKRIAFLKSLGPH